MKKWRRIAYRAGRRCGSIFKKENRGSETAKFAMNRDWNLWKPHLPRDLRETLHEAASRKFYKGFCEKAREKYVRTISLPTDKKVAAIISFMSEDDTIFKVLDELRCLPLYEII
ncbi:hypothetical protein GC098_10360, partial [Paenibacillus sp. LMG 31458]|nr:hypothetical protein [Paenibacillus phytorum]